MGVGGLITGIMGATGAYPKASVPGAGRVTKDYLGLVKGYEQAQPDIFATESKYQPMYTDLALSNLARAIPSFSNILSGAAPGAAGVVRGVNPGQTRLLDTLTSQAQEGLDAGTSLDPGLERLFSQSVRGGQASRGLGFGPSDVLQESLGVTNLGQQLRQYRQGFAGNVSNLGFNEETAPTLGLLTDLVGGGGKVASSSGPSLFPSNQSYDLFNTAYNARAAAGIADQNAQTALLGGFNSFD